MEASPQALPRFLHALPHPLSYPVAVDQDGRLADGYRVQDSPWLALVSRSGRILSAEDLAVKGWPTLRQLLRQMLELGVSKWHPDPVGAIEAARKATT